jgi:hypothetical protein
MQRQTRHWGGCDQQRRGEHTFVIGDSMPTEVSIFKISRFRMPIFTHSIFFLQSRKVDQFKFQKHYTFRKMKTKHLTG